MEKGKIIQYLVSLAVSIATVTVGVSRAWSTTVLPKFHNNETGIHITESEVSWLAAIASPGFVTGCFITRFISDRFGRRTVILASAVPYIIATVIVLYSSTAWTLYIPKFVWGVGAGMIGSVTAIYIAEISDTEIRGSLLATNRFMMNFGSFLIMSVGPFVSFNVINCTFIVMPICYFIACCFVPETPYYYLKEGKVDEARKAMIRLGDKKDEQVLEDKLEAMREQVRKEMLRSGSVKELFTGKQYRKALIIITGVKLTQMMAGSIAILQYMGLIIQESKTNISVSTALIVFGAVRFIVGIFPSVLVDRIGRRPLLIYSYFFSGVTLAIVAVYFYIEPTSSIYFGLIPFVGIIIYTILSSVGFDTIAYVILGELFPINVKSVAVTYVLFLGGFLNFLSVKGYQQMKDIAGLGGVFTFYAIWALIGAVFAYFIVPETKGKSLKEIQVELQGVYYDEAEEKLNKIAVKNDIPELNNLEKK